MSAGKKKFVRTSLALLCVIAPMVAWLGFGQHGFIHLYGVGKERQACEQMIKKLTEENQTLFDEIQRLRTDSKYVEQVARKELGLVKENEIIYRFQEEEKPETVPDQHMKGETPRKGISAHTN